MLAFSKRLPACGANVVATALLVVTSFNSSVQAQPPGTNGLGGTGAPTEAENALPAAGASTTIRDDEAMIAQALAEMPPEIAEEAKAARAKFKIEEKKLADEIYRLRELQVRFVNAIDDGPAAAKVFRQQRLLVRELLDEHFRQALVVFRYLPSSEAASYLVTMIQNYYRTDQYDKDAFEAAARLIDVGQQYQYLFQMVGRAGVANGEFETAKKVYEALKDENLDDTDRRLIAQFDVIQEQYAAEQERLAATDPATRPQVRLETTQGDILLELFPESAPSTVAHFLKLVEQGFYDGLDFTQVMSGLLALTGDPTGDGRGNSGEFLIDEHRRDGAHDALRGSLIMAKIPKGTNDFIENSASSQIAITFLPLPPVSEHQTVFGRVIEGMDAVSSLRRVDPTKEASKKEVKLPPDSIIAAEVVRRGEELPPPNYVDFKAMMKAASQ